jgi:hypothetical protein
MFQWILANTTTVVVIILVFIVFWIIKKRIEWTSKKHFFGNSDRTEFQSRWAEELQTVYIHLLPWYRNRVPLPFKPYNPESINRYLAEVTPYLDRSYTIKRSVPLFLMAVGFVLLGNQIHLHNQKSDLEARASNLGWDVQIGGLKILGGLPNEINGELGLEQRQGEGAAWLNQDSLEFVSQLISESESNLEWVLQFKKEHGHFPTLPWDEQLFSRILKIDPAIQSVRVIQSPSLDAPNSKYDFEIMTTEVTQELYSLVTDTNPSFFHSCESCPLENISWVEAIAFSNALNSLLSLDECYQINDATVIWKTECAGWRLPTNDEWAYAARANGGFVYSGGKNINKLAWYERDSLLTEPPSGPCNTELYNCPHSVGQLSPNSFGLYDMSGNVSEWVWGSIFPTQDQGSSSDRSKSKAGACSETECELQISTLKSTRGCSWASSEELCEIDIVAPFITHIGSKNIGLRLIRSR